MTRTLALILAVLFACPATAMVGDAPTADANGLGRHVVMVVGSRGSFCSATAIARDLVLTAVHCVPRGADYKVVERGIGGPRLKGIVRIERHPAFTERGMTTYRGTADVALAKLGEPLQSSIRPVPLGGAGLTVKVGDMFTIAGFGVTHPGDADSVGTLRTARLVATGKPDGMDVRLVNPAARNTRAGRGACTGDSGGPVFAESGGQLTVVGVISWTTGPNTTRGCGGITGMTPLARYRGWVVDTARKLGAPLE